MRKKKWLLTMVLAVPLGAAGLVYAQTILRVGQPENAASYICPLTGEQLPCPQCCPINNE